MAPDVLVPIGVIAVPALPTPERSAETHDTRLLAALRFEPRITGITDKKGGAMTLAFVETRVTNQHGVHVADCSRTVVVLNKVTA